MSNSIIYVLRIGHRIHRDKRIAMHIFLTARAFSAHGVIYSGMQDNALENRIHRVVQRWGGSFAVKYTKNWKLFIEEWKTRGVVCHLTMYGVDIDECLKTIPKGKDLLIVIGSQKVPNEVFQIADYNIAVGNQPHSEVAALAIFLDRLFKGKGLRRDFHDAQFRVIPQIRGKKTEETLELPRRSSS